MQRDLEVKTENTEEKKKENTLTEILTLSKQYHGQGVQSASID